MDVKEAIKELRDSYELKHRDWAYRCLETIEAELEKKGTIINLMAKKLVEAHGWFYSEFDNFTEKDWIEYFRKKVAEINVGDMQEQN